MNGKSLQKRKTTLELNHRLFLQVSFIIFMIVFISCLLILTVAGQGSNGVTGGI